MSARSRPIILQRGNKVRVVYSVSKRAKQYLRSFLDTLYQAERAAAAAAGTSQVAHGFVPGRSQVSMALAHVNFRLTVSLDLTDWFDSVRPEQIMDGLQLAGWPQDQAAAMVQRLCSYGRPPSYRADELAPRQGWPTSPVAGNLAAVRLDREVLDRLSVLPCPWVYTRYADDLVISTADDDPALIAIIRHHVSAAAASMQWRIAEHKTTSYSARAGRRIVAGIAVDDTGIHPTRYTRRKLRAWQHSRPTHIRTRGLIQWASCPLPWGLRNGGQSRNLTNDAETDNGETIQSRQRRNMEEEA